MDRREVQATLGIDEPAVKMLELDEAVEAAKIGFGKVNILTLGNRLEFGIYNDRPVKTSEVNKMITSFEKHGIQWFKAENALAIVLKRSRISADQLENGVLEGDWNAQELTTVEFVDEQPLQLASGQHRVTALWKHSNNYEEEEAALCKRIERLNDKDQLTTDETQEHKELRVRLGEVRGHLKELGQWSVKLYDIGKYMRLQSPPLDDKVNDIRLNDLPDMINAKKDLGKHLSQNQTLHIYSETAEEQLVSILRDMHDAYIKDGMAEALDVLAQENEKPAINKDSKLTKVLRNTRLVTILMKDMLPLGPHFGYRREFSVRWLATGMDTIMGVSTTKV